MKKQLVKISFFLVITILALTSGFCVKDIEEASAQSETQIDTLSHCGDKETHSEKSHGNNHTNSILPCCTDGTPADLIIAYSADLDGVFLTSIDFEALSIYLQLASGQNTYKKDRGSTRSDFSILRL